MTSRRRVRIIFMITLSMILAQMNLASSQTVTLGGGQDAQQAIE